MIGPDAQPNALFERRYSVRLFFSHQASQDRTPDLFIGEQQREQERSDRLSLISTETRRERLFIGYIQQRVDLVHAAMISDLKIRTKLPERLRGRLLDQAKARPIVRDAQVSCRVDNQADGQLSQL